MTEIPITSQERGSKVILREPLLSPERDKFRTEAAYAFNRGISLLAINTLRQLKEWERNGHAFVRDLKTIEGRTAVVYETTPKTPHRLRAVIVPDDQGTASRITIEKISGKGPRRREEYYEIRLGDSPTYREAKKYTNVNGARVTEIREYQYSDYQREVSGSYCRGFSLAQQQTGRPPFKFGEITINYSQGYNFLEAGDLQLSFSDRLEPIEDAFLDLVRPDVLGSAAESVREAIGKPKPRRFSKVQVLSEAGIVERVTFEYDGKTGTFRAPGKAKWAPKGNYVNVGSKKRGVSIPAEIKSDEDFIVRPFDKFRVESIEQLSGSRTFVQTRLSAPASIPADSSRKEYLVPQRVIGT